MTTRITPKPDPPAQTTVPRSTDSEYKEPLESVVDGIVYHRPMSSDLVYKVR